ncbi:UNC93-like protein isoform X2 [Coccinella septempunctata]|nr:UNC93-like protein isoform X2 [Coccinella septempunctata]
MPTINAEFEPVRTDENEDEFKPGEKLRIWKNVLVLGFAFMLHFTAFWGASNLQSSVNADEALGTFTLAAIYSSLIISNIFLSSFVIDIMTIKWTMCYAFITYMPFIGAQFYPKFYTMIPAGLAVGLGGGPLWCAKCTYLTIISRAYSKITGVPSEIIYPRFFGIFFMFYAMSQVWGNLISSAVLSSGEPAPILSDNGTLQNITSVFTETLSELGSDEICGAKFCLAELNKTANPNLQKPQDSKIRLISGIYLVCMLLASLIIGIGLDSMKRYTKRKNGDTIRISSWKLLAVTCKHLRNPFQLLLLPIMMFIGAEQAFIAADYTVAYVTCGWGVENIGFVMICFGVCNGIASTFIGGLSRIFGRKFFISLGFILHLSLIVVLHFWMPGSKSRLVYFAISGFWGFSDAIWLVQIHSLNSILFQGKEEAAYSNFRLWESLGSVITYAYGPFLCTHLKLYWLIFLLFIGIICYSVIEHKHSRKEKEESLKGTKFTPIKN